MSNNQLTDSGEVKYVPKLRFTEFSNPWRISDLSKISEKPLYGMNSASKEFDGENKYLRITDIDESTRLFDTTKLTSPDGELNVKYLLSQNDLLFARTGASVGKSYLYNINDGKVFFAGFLIKFKIKEIVIPQFIFYQTLTSSYSTWVKKTSARSGQPGINAEEYSGLEILLTSKQEQQKIVDCLSSLDELIQNESSKLDIYKQHKNGLLQQLFPRDGRSLPSLRFDEFSENWEHVELSKISKLIKDRVGEKTLVPMSISAGKGFITQKEKFGRDISGNQYSKYTLLKKGDFSFNKGNSKSYPQGCVYILKDQDEIAVPSVYISFRIDKKNCNHDFYQQFFIKNGHGSQLKKYITSGARSDGLLNININDFFKVVVPYPSIAEQQKIATTLISLDELITHQTNYIEQLKQHKKGLMQQLFPVLEDVSA